METMNEYCSMLFFSFLNELTDSIDNILVDKILYVILCPIEGKKTHSLDSGVIGTLSSCTINDMCYLIKT